MKYYVKRMICIATLFACIGLFSIQASAGSTSNYTLSIGDTKYLYTNAGGRTVVGAAWTTSNVNAVDIVQQSSFSCKIKVMSYTGSPVIIHCTYYFRELSGKYMYQRQDYTDYYITIQKPAEDTKNPPNQSGSHSYGETPSNTHPAETPPVRMEQQLKTTIGTESIIEGETTRITVNGIGDISYESEDPSIATVDKQGTVRGISEGTARICVRAAGNTTYLPASATVTIYVRKAPVSTSTSVPESTQGSTSAGTPSIYLNKTSAVLYPGQKLSLSVSNAKGMRVYWYSYNSRIAQVSSGGTVTARNSGSTAIYARVNGRTLTCRIDVKKVLSVSTSKLKVSRGRKKTVTVTFRSYGTVRCRIMNNKYISCSWKKFKGDNCKLVIRGKKKGITTIVISNSVNSEKIKIRVTVR